MKGVRPRRAFAVTAAAALVAGALAACSSGTSSSPSSSDAGDGGNSGGSGEVIKLGVMGDHTSQTGTSYSGIPAVVHRLVEDLNAAGGIEGRKVELVECDLQGLADQASRCARQMVSGGATAVLAQVGLGIEKVPPIFQEAKIAYFPAYTLAQADMESEASFPVVPGILSQMGGGWIASHSKCEKPVWVLAESPSTEFMKGLATTGFKAGGGDPAAMTFVTFPLTQSDFAPVAAEVVGHNPDCIMPYLNETMNLQFYPALVQTGWKDRDPERNRLMGYQGGVYTQRVLEEFPELVEGLRAVDLSRAFNNPAWGEFSTILDDLKDDGLTNLTSSFTKHTYINFLAWVDTVKQVIADGDEVTNETVFDKLSTGTIDVSDFTAPFSTANGGSFPEWPRLFNTSLILEEVKDGQLSELNNGEWVDLGPDIAAVVG